MVTMRLLFLPLLVGSASATTHAAPPSLSADPTGCFTDLVTRLSTDEMDGRGVGTEGNARAADLIAATLAMEGLTDPGKHYRQAFTVTTGVSLGAENLLAVTTGGATTPLALGTAFSPLGFSRSGAFAGGVVFAGYGIRATELGYDDYAGLDVKGKVVLAMRYEPGEEDDASPFDGKRPSRWSDLRAKAIVAREAGAAALLLVGPATHPDDPDKLPPLKTLGPLSDAGIPVIQVTRAEADLLLASAGLTLAQARDAIDHSYKPASRPLPDVSLRGRVDLHPVSATAENLVGVIPGRGALKDQVVVVGAHYDHLGHGGAGSFTPDVDAIHNGADDNASGVAAVVCAAGALVRSARADKADRRTVAVVAFSAEEIGLGGSGWYVQHPVVGTLANTAAMINLDMVGRLRDEKLAVLGTDSSPGWQALLDLAKGAAPELNLTTGGDGYGPSDHASFYGEGVPVVHLFTGAHPQYHTPDDDVALLDMDGGGQVSRFTSALVEAASHADRLAYARGTGSPMVGDSRGYGAYFGSVPDYTAMAAATGGVKLSDVRPGSPAERAGLRKGDVIVGMAGMKIENLYDMTFVLREHRPNETIAVVVDRAGATVTMHATLAVRGGDPAPPAAPAPTPHASFSVGAEPPPAGPSVDRPASGKSWAPRAGTDAQALLRTDEPHLADLRRLTFGGENAEAYWGPDGRHLSFQRTPPGGGCDAEYVLDLDSGNVTLASSGKGRTTCGYIDYPKGDSWIYATTEAASAECPARPDHTQGYVWALYDDYDIVRADATGHTTPLLASPGYDAEATECSKDGRVVFTSTRNGDIDLFVANADGSGVKQLTNTPGYDGGAFFTRDCRKIVFRASRPTGDDLADYRHLLDQKLVRPTSLEIYVMDADGSHVRQLTHDAAASFAPFPTPDGKGILYSSNVGGDAREFDLWYVGYDGKPPTRITTAPGFDGFPMFSPDGAWLVFASNRADPPGGHDTDLYVARWK
jgi:Tol biopolymer transport system component